MRFGHKLFRTYVSLIRDNCNFHCLYGNMKVLHCVRALYLIPTTSRLHLRPRSTYHAINWNIAVTITLLTTTRIINLFGRKEIYIVFHFFCCSLLRGVVLSFPSYLSLEFLHFLLLRLFDYYMIYISYISFIIFWLR